MTKSRTAVATNNKGAVMRPLKTLVPLIKKKIAEIGKVAMRATRTHWQELGTLFEEARRHFYIGPRQENADGQTFHDWARENFTHPLTGEPAAARTVQEWMQGVRKLKEARARRGSPGLTELTRASSSKHEDYKPHLDWQAGVRGVQQRLNLEELAKKRDDEEKEERELRQLALKIIDAGYRALSAVVHPDKPQGNKVAFQKLTKAKNWLKEAISQ